MPQPKTSRLLGKGVALRSQTKCILMNVFRNISDENPNMSCSAIQDRVANLCGISVHSLRKLLTEEKQLGNNDMFSTPGKIGPRKIKKVNIDDFQKSALRRIVLNFHKTYHILPILRSVLKVLKVENPEWELNVNHETLRKI
uniref:Uncharacterized protein n=1 Tax=Clastoptera arizonana TaxID=38151 RepID=A0A1B6CI51_9HEMI